MLHRAALFASAWLVFAAPPAPLAAQEPDPARIAAAKELMQAAGVARQFDEVMPLLTKQIADSFVVLAPDKSSEIREVFGQLAIKFVDRKGELIDKIAEVYAEKLTAEDISALTAFYKSPAGIKFIAVQPEIMRRSVMLGHRWGQALGREIDEEARRELKKRGVDL
ncbi:MAG TPA: DUF2059 domain-containing protein [Hyphomicrobiaceae bacterium]|nr:DUF2059 domain-containing protein [Hyphomicrobiaceae bacterium]